MRRRIASLLAFVLIFTSGLHAFASEPDWETGENIGGSSVSSMPEPDAAEQQEKEKAEASEEEFKGQVNVAVR